MTKFEFLERAAIALVASSWSEGRTEFELSESDAVEKARAMAEELGDNLDHSWDLQKFR